MSGPSISLAAPVVQTFFVFSVVPRRAVVQIHNHCLPCLASTQGYYCPVLPVGHPISIPIGLWRCVADACISGKMKRFVYMYVYAVCSKHMAMMKKGKAGGIRDGLENLGALV
jgi:hypothetical protein